jgi:E3 ubiquitin-protein ligase RNF146
MESKINIDQPEENKLEETDTLLQEDCSVCLQPHLQPIKLSCNHVFCFLCIKGVTVNHHQNACPMCRCPIPPQYLNNPDIFAVKCSKRAYSDEEEKCRWLYSGKKGWWEYDERTSENINQGYNVFVSQKEPKLKRKKKNSKESANTNTTQGIYEIMIAGLIYIVDFHNMIQYRKDNPHRKRKIKREMTKDIIDCKGVAGLRKIDKTLNVECLPVTDNKSGVIEPSSSKSLMYNKKQLTTLQIDKQLKRETMDNKQSSNVSKQSTGATIDIVQVGDEEKRQGIE